MMPQETLTDVTALRWINQLRRYHSEIGHTLGLFDKLASMTSLEPSTEKT